MPIETRHLQLGDIVPRHPDANPLPLDGAPRSADDSIFNKPRIAQVIGDMVGYFTQNSTSRDKRAAVDRLARSTSLSPFRHAVHQLTGNSERTREYQTLSARVTEAFSRRTKTELPERSELEVPRFSFDLVNMCFSNAYPDQFGSILPPLSQDVVMVVPDEELDRYIILELQRKSASVESSGKINPLNADDINLARIKGKGINLQVLWEEPNRPILIRESFVRNVFDSHPPGDQQAGLNFAFSLMHEGIHRTQGDQEVITENPDDPLINLALAPYANSIGEISDTEERWIQEEGLKNFKDSLSYRYPSVHLSGALLQLRCDDDSGIERVVNQIGYDLNEALTELLAESPILEMHKIIIERGRGLEWYKKQIIKDYPADKGLNASVYNKRVPRGKALEYMRSLGIHDMRQLLQAMHEGNIPILHAQKFPNLPYGN